MRYGRCRAVRLKHDARRASADSGGSSMPGGERATRARLAGPPVLALYRLAVAVPVSAWLAAGTAGWGGRLPGLSLAQAAGWVLVLVLFELLPAPRRGGPGLRVTFAAQVAIALLYPAQVAATLAFLGGVEARPLRRRGSPLGTWSHHAEQALVTALGSATFRLLATFHAPWPRLLAASLAASVRRPRHGLVRPARRPPVPLRGLLADARAARAAVVRAQEVPADRRPGRPPGGPERAARQPVPGAAHPPCPRAADRGRAAAPEPHARPVRGDGLPRGPHPADRDHRLRHHPAPRPGGRRPAAARHLPRHHRAPGPAAARPGREPAHGLQPGARRAGRHAGADVGAGAVQGGGRGPRRGRRAGAPQAPARPAAAGDRPPLPRPGARQPAGERRQVRAGGERLRARRPPGRGVAGAVGARPRRRHPRARARPHLRPLLPGRRVRHTRGDRRRPRPLPGPGPGPPARRDRLGEQQVGGGKLLHRAAAAEPAVTGARGGPARPRRQQHPRPAPPREAMAPRRRSAGR